MTVAEFINSLGLPARRVTRLTRAIGRNSDTLVRDLKPDVLIIEPNSLVTILDLTSQLRADHLLKTAFYRAILSTGRTLDLPIAEIYWRAISS